MDTRGRVILIRIPPREFCIVTGFVILLALCALGFPLAAWLIGPEVMEYSSTPAFVPPSNAQLADKKLNVRVESLLARMSLDDKIGQLTQYTAGALTGPGSGKDDYDEMITKGQVGSLFNAVGAKLTNHYQHLAAGHNCQKRGIAQNVKQVW